MCGQTEVIAKSAVTAAAPPANAHTLDTDKIFIDEESSATAQLDLDIKSNVIRKQTMYGKRHNPMKHARIAI